jgi:hypothetical protein
MADWSLTARLDEHRLSKNTMGLVCAFGEQERPTAVVPTHLDKTPCFHYKGQQLTVALAFEEQFAAPLMRSASSILSPH